MKLNNIVVIGGPISVGKSTIVKKLPWAKVMELDNKDHITKMLLEATYKKERIAPEVIEYTFCEIRKKRYETFAQLKENLYIFDRSVFESIIFAHKNLNAQSFNHFYKFWLSSTKKLLKKHGKPKLYILLEIDWKNFQERFFTRNSKVETKYFEQNKDFFKIHVEQYSDIMKSILKKFKISFTIINTNDLTIEEVLAIVNQKIVEVI